jgi:hypothetical protein
MGISPTTGPLRVSACGVFSFSLFSSSPFSLLSLFSSLSFSGLPSGGLGTSTTLCKLINLGGISGLLPTLPYPAALPELLKLP